MFRSQVREDESYLATLAKLLPAEMVAAYTALNGIAVEAGDLGDAQKIMFGWIIFGVMSIVTIVYLLLTNRKNKPPDKMAWWEIAISVGSFAIWALAVSGLMRETFTWWLQTIESLVVAFWTLVIPALVGAAKGQRWTKRSS